MKAKALLGLAAVGLAAGVVVPGVGAQSVGTQSTNTEVEVIVDNTLQISSSGKVSIGVMPTGDGTLATGTDNVKVSTNGGSGYTLSIKDADADLALNSAAGTTPIAASPNAWASPNVTALTTNTWGYRVESSADFVATGAYVGITAADQEIKQTGGDAVDDLTQVTFGVNVTTATNNGTYTDVVVYTAVNN
jgi:hypothetical protein